MLLLAMLWAVFGDDFASAANSIVATVISLFSALSVWAWRWSARQGRSTTGQLTEAQRTLARLVERQWREEAGLRQLQSPRPLPVSWSWSDALEVGVRDHEELIGETISCRADQVEELAAAFRRLPRRRLVVLGDAGSGKTTFAVLLALSLLHTRQGQDDEPVPVLLTAASFAPQENIRGWLHRRITADYPALADVDAYGPSAIDDLLTAHRILPVIDGLDELPESVHVAVLTALCESLDTDAPLVLTCRTTEYTAAAAVSGALPRAAVVAPTDLSAQQSLELLRLATSTGPSQQRWDSLAGHVAEHPAGPVAEALSSPLIVTLARTVYAEGAGDPGELRNFASKEDIEGHLLDALVPMVYTTARHRDLGGRTWPPERAHHYFVQLASGMQRQNTTDLEWWQLHRWVPASAVSRVWVRCAAWSVAVFVLTLLGTAAGRVFPEYSPKRLGSVEWVPGSVAVAVLCMCLLAAWIATRPGLSARRLAGVVLAAECGALAFALPGMSVGVKVDGEPVASELYAIACMFHWGFVFLLVLYHAGPPVPPLLPSNGTLAPGNWSRRLLRAMATVLATTALAAAAVHLYAPVLREVAARHLGPPDYPAELPWTQCLMLGIVFGTLQALLHWVRGTTSTQEVTNPVSAVRADRLVTLVGCGAGFILVTLPYIIAVLVVCAGYVERGQQSHILLTFFVCALLGVGPVGLILALAAHAWPYYTAARLLLAVRGRLPWRLQAFLSNAHQLGILRQVGPVYQFRHARLQERLAGTVHVPGPRTPSSEPDLQPGANSLR